MENCKESFLDGVVGVAVYPDQAVKLQVPFSLRQTLSVNNPTLGVSAFKASISGENGVIADNITAKAAPTVSENGIVFSHEITISVVAGVDEVRKAHKNIGAEYHHVVLTTANGQQYLCYACPGSFSFIPSATKTASDNSISLAVSLKSMSEFILITNT